ncbi:MAG: RNA 2',3'-cyclic phosphodiesterase [Planctomycetes bacterium]|nr:RNA 2',3'-cyclic phosphodiesterase [Planctomycetota bacterium]
MRAFLAIEIPPEAAGALVEAGRDLSQKASSFRVVHAEAMHGTIAFLGEIGEDDAEVVTTAVGSALSECDPFVLALGGAGLFPEKGPPRVAWIGALEGAEPSALLAAKITDSLRDLGLRTEERAWRFHVTVARARLDARGAAGFRGAEQWCRDWANRRCGRPFRVERVVLFESLLQPHGSRYLVRATLPLRGCAESR